ncbi:hypothetical protein [Marinoscillum sp. MHG1-6]|uniref:hypothetical protein n=1 Tax=Marinoscillum sp. MHG1-6 TaxID=2959627 RepID=UPI002157660D|nr:hypothetical protein [Marinoscillum sp. MHG1-6]
METPQWLGIVIVLAPIIIFILTMIVVRARLKDQNVSLADLLAETEIELQKQSGTPPTSGQPATPVKRSASRLILFLSGVTSLILGVCITTFYFYMNIYCISCTGGLDLSDFTNVILALGIGVVPYSVNQVKKFKL